MADMEKAIRDVVLAGIGAAAKAREDSESLLRTLADKGEAVVKKSGIANELLRHNDDDKAGQTEEDCRNPAEEIVKMVKSLSAEQLAALKAAIAKAEEKTDA